MWQGARGEGHWDAHDVWLRMFLLLGCRETNALKAAVEQSKNEVLRYSLSLILALVAAGLTAARVLPDFSKK